MADIDIETSEATRPTVELEESEDDSSEDEDAHLKQIRPGKGSERIGSLRRQQSWEDFMTRSERNRIQGKDKPPNPKDLKKHKVGFRDSLESVHEIDPIVEEEVKRSYWMTDEDFDRIDEDLRMTYFRWENHRAGKIKFDQERGTLRGLESIMEQREGIRTKHRDNVLKEIHDQKVKGKEIDWDKVREAALKCSKQESERAIHVAEEDADIGMALDKWPVQKSNEKSSSKSAKKSSMKKKAKNVFMFWKK